MKLAYAHALNHEKIAAIDARYTDLKKDQQIARQNEEILSEKGRKRQLALLFSITVLFLAVLAYFYVQLQQANRKSRKQAEQLKSLDAAKSRFFANISHELRTPLTLLLGPVNTLLKEDQLSEKQTRLLGMARRSGVQLQQLINEILDLRKLEMGKMDLLPEPTHLLAFFRSYTAQFESIAERQSIHLTFDSPIKPHQIAGIDRGKCRQILNNLLSNAFKFTPEGGTIAVYLALGEHQTLHLSVSDTGRGIHPDDLPQVFDRFFQTNRRDKAAEGGTGIGLNLCREYAHLFGGDISAESAPGKGSIFRVSFPVSLTEAPATWAEEEIGSDPFVQDNRRDHAKAPMLAGDASNEVSRPTILVVEDNPDLQTYLRVILQEQYRVAVAGNGEEALEKIYSGMPFDLVVSDLMMPVMDGYQLLERLKSEDVTSHIPVIMLTARAEARDKLKALRIGVDDYLTKPFDEEELKLRIDSLLRNQSARRAETETEATAAPALSQTDRAWLEGFESYVQYHLSEDRLSVS